MEIERTKKWTLDELRTAVRTSESTRSTLKKIGLIPAGGNYTQIEKYIKKYNIDTSHFKGKAWNRGLKHAYKPLTPLYELLTLNSHVQSNKLKKKLFLSKLKKPSCELCGWAKKSKDGRIPVELDHINGDRTDNRLVNLRILCPNCHSLQLTHRGKNIKRASGGTGIRAPLKMVSQTR